MRVLSLFDGISCGRVALDRAGFKVSEYVAFEIDPDAIACAKENYVNTKHMGDVSGADFTPYKGFDILIGGSPCQGFSFMGKRLNFEDPRSMLFFEYVRALCVVKPKYFLFENVKMSKESEAVISAYLECEPVRINSKLVSAQLRDRLYWTNIPSVEPPADRGILLRDIIEDGYVNRDKALCIDANYAKGTSLKRYFEKAKRQIVFDTPDMDRYTLSSWRHLTPLECELLQTLPEGYTAGRSNAKRYKMLGNGWTVDVIAHILSYIKYA